MSCILISNIYIFSQIKVTAAHWLLVTVIFVLLLAVTNGDICRRQPIRIVLQRDGCSPRALLAFGCGGACTSYSSPSSESPMELEHFCQCCDAIDYANRRVTIECWDASYSYPRDIHVTMNLPRTCRCRPCSDTPDNFIPADDFWNRGKRVLPIVVYNSNDTNIENDLHKPFIHIEDPDLKFTVEPLTFF